MRYIFNKCVGAQTVLLQKAHCFLAYSVSVAQ